MSSTKKANNTNTKILFNDFLKKYQDSSSESIIDRSNEILYSLNTDPVRNSDLLEEHPINMNRQSRIDNKTLIFINKDAIL